jgi:hypothetical protein
MAPTLAEIEKALTTLWTSRGALERFMSGDDSGLDPAIASQIDKDRFVIYAQVLQVKHYETMAMTFPLTEKLLGDDWDDVVEDYRDAYPPSSYRSNRAGEFFRRYIESQLDPKLKERFPYLPELVDYEFAESEMIDFDDSEFQYDSDECKLQSAEEFTGFKPLVNPAIVVRRYEYPILAIAEKLEEDSDELPENVKAEPSNLLIYRDPRDNEVRFLSVGDVAAAIIESAQEPTGSYSNLAALAVSMNPAQDPQSTLGDFIALVASLQAKNVFLGHRRI